MTPPRVPTGKFIAIPWFFLIGCAPKAPSPDVIVDGVTIIDGTGAAPAPDRAVCDAGSKTLSSDPLRPAGPGHGAVLGRRSRIAKLSEEHGVIAVEPGESFRVGERIRILPNHACIVSNLHDRLVAVRNGRVEGQITVAARGCVQ